ncbi:MAG: histidine--tRNA ligase [Phycisphaerales bacterium]|nr:histidine--tRNA ligase [Phycisphaerales bacterium]
MINPSLPQGTRDFDAGTLEKRKYLFGIIEKHFKRFAFEPLETPTFENLSVLSGKYGEEGDKLMFKILNNGLDEKTKHASLQQDLEQKIFMGKSSMLFSDRALRYDLTIPFARYVAMNINQLVFPFKRYQIQPVWRADRPQKGRYREFYQCDADIVGSQSLLNESELIRLMISVFSELKLSVIIKINNRKVLNALMDYIKAPHLLNVFARTIDKINKIGLSKVFEELSVSGFDSNQMDYLDQFLKIAGPNDEKIEKLMQLIPNESCQLAVQEIKAVLAYCDMNELKLELDTQSLDHVLELDFTLARGLDYYSGTIFEVETVSSNQSIAGGGRYDNLIGYFSKNTLPGIGISFGVERIYDMMSELNLFPQGTSNQQKILLFNMSYSNDAMGQKLQQETMMLLSTLRKAGLTANWYLDTVKFDKQFKYAEKKQYTHAVFLGPTEIENKQVKIKDLLKGQEVLTPLANVVFFFLGT